MKLFRQNKKPRARQTDGSVPAPPSCPLGFLYTVQAGESLTRIANRFNVRLEDLLRVNPQIADPSLIFVGQSICIPFVDPECPSGLIVEVQEGDTLHQIARMFSVSVQELLALNPQLTNPDLLIPGQRICLPESARIQ